MAALTAASTASHRRHRGVLEVQKRSETDTESAPSSQPPPKNTRCESGEQQTTRHGAADANGRSCGVTETSATHNDAAPGSDTKHKPSETSHPTQPAVASIASFGTLGLTTARQSLGPKSSPARKRSVSKRAQTRKRNHPPPSFLETSRVDGVKAPLHFKTRRYAPAKPLSATASIAPPEATFVSVCRNSMTQPPCFRGIKPLGAAANESTRHRGYELLRAASNPKAINVVDAG